MQAAQPTSSAPSAEDRPKPAGRPDLFPPYVQTANAVAVAIPFAVTVVAIIWLWGFGMGWAPLLIMLAMYILTGLGVTLGFHRLVTHRSFETSRAVRAVLIVLASMASQGPLFQWVANHRKHHQHSDSEGDPHSPHLHGGGVWGVLRGMWHAHLGWVFHPDAPELTGYVPDLAADALTRRLSGLYLLWVFLGLLIPAAIGGLITHSWTGAFLCLIWGGLVRIVLVHHLTWSINSICHVWGSRPFRTHDQSRNNALFGVLGLGEGWHNNHHAFPTSARHGLRWWEFDLSYLVLRLMAAAGLVWAVRLPGAQALADKRRSGLLPG